MCQDEEESRTEEITVTEKIGKEGSNHSGSQCHQNPI